MVKYFTMDTQNAIARFQFEEKQEEREKIWEKEILPAFGTLVNNLINVYGFKTLHESREELRLECVEFLYTTLHKYDPTRSTKAFSYFNVVAKNWLTVRSKQNVKRMQRFISIDDKDSLSIADANKIEDYNFLASFEESKNPLQERQELKELIEKVSSAARTKDEKSTMEAIKQVVENLDDLDILSKRAVLLYLREITNLTPRQLSTALSNIRKHYRKIKKEELEKI